MMLKMTSFFQCSNDSCRVAYHPLCARASGLCVEVLSYLAHKCTQNTASPQEMFLTEMAILTVYVA